MVGDISGYSLDMAKARFHRACRWIALAFLAVSGVVAMRFSPTCQDLSGIYIGPVVARQGSWGALYPIVQPDGRFYVGEKGAGFQKPELLDIAAEHGIQELNPYLNPPWQAVLLLPLGWLRFQQAHWVVVLINIFCVWIVAMSAGRGFEICARRRSWAAGFITLLVATSPLAYRSIRVQNLSPAVALCIVMTLWDLLGKSVGGGFVGGLGTAWGALFKGATAALLPLAVAMRRWRLLGWAAGLVVLVIAITWQLAGAATFREFFGSIAPTLGRSSVNVGNKSLQGILLRVLGVAPLPQAWHMAMRAFAVLCLALIAWPLFRPRPADRAKFWTEPAHVFAGAAALLAWLLIFSPLCWEHYFIYFCPLWGWLLWEGTRSRTRMTVSVLAIALHWFPLPEWRRLHLPEPWNSYMLAALFLIFAIALSRLYFPAPSSQSDGG